MDEEKDFKNALKNKKVPILVLDQKWHRLFALSGKTDAIQKMESELNTLLERQGQLNNDVKDMKKAKARLMDSIVQNMEGTHAENSGAIESKKLEEDRRLIDELNEKISQAEDELLELPAFIRTKNEELMLESMNFCYNRLRTNMEEAGEITDWIVKIRKDLKKNIIKKQNREVNNRQIYSYMHDIFGVEIIDLFDLKYEDVEQKFEKKKETDKTNSENAEKAKEPNEPKET